jgi:predicted AAA+ superfamily ATPase
MARYLSEPLKVFARDKFVLLSGPRQVGKTTLAQAWASRRKGKSLYLNWDVPEHRESILKRDFLADPNLDALVLDEIHKYGRWKSWLKGLYDREGKRLEVVVTGSARLELFQRSGDSLLGRYESLRLHPLTVGELTHGEPTPPPKDWLRLEPREVPAELWTRLEKTSGFPEPFHKDDLLQHQRWSTRRRNLLIREDLRDLSQIRDLSLVEHLAILLPSRVGSPLSLNALREELQVAHDTIRSWIEALDRLYFCFRLSPYHRRISRSLTKERKLYLWDWSQVEDEGARFENTVAGHLLKAVHAWTDLGHGEFDLRYLRDKEKNEVDFVVTERNRPQALIECKLGEEKPAPSLLKLGAQLGRLPLLQLIKKQGVDRLRQNVRVVSADRFLAGLM